MNFHKILLSLLSLFFLTIFSCKTYATINSDILTKYEIEELLRDKINYQKKVDLISNKISKKFLTECKNQVNSLGFKTISKKISIEVCKQLEGQICLAKLKKIILPLMNLCLEV